MPITDREYREQQKQRVIELLEQGLSTRIIHERLGVTQRQVLRIKKWLDSSRESPIDLDDDRR